MKKSNASLIASACFALGLLASGNAHAVWTFNTASSTVTGSASGEGTVSISGAYATNGSNNSGFASGAKWQSGSLISYGSGGLGMASDGSSEPNHAIDNAGTNTESVLLQFSSSTILTSIGLGYVSGDADISLFRYVGTSTTPTVVGVGAGKDAMAAAGWELVGNYANLAVDTSNPYNLVNGGSSATKGSSWWLISAYNTSYGTGTGLTQGDDYFKLYAVAGKACTTGGDCGSTPPRAGVPEPGSLALAGLALFGLAYTRRQQAKR